MEAAVSRAAANVSMDATVTTVVVLAELAFFKQHFLP